MLVGFRLLNVITLSWWLFSFEADVCFCDGRRYFYDHCAFTGPLDYTCLKVKNETEPLPANIDKRLLKCISFFQRPDSWDGDITDTVYAADNFEVGQLLKYAVMG